jgi:hypothetical protein
LKVAVALYAASFGSDAKENGHEKAGPQAGF